MELCHKLVDRFQDLLKVKNPAVSKAKVCHHYTNIRVTLLNSVAEIIGNVFNINNECLVNLLLFGGQKYTEIDNSHIVNATIKYLLDSGRFNGPLL